ncbi:hypothetical protein [Streptomyces sp. NPDC088726]|uniref:hypothetical protein n=1 Tax=Streptomyces sp. NPDC088726 TaxID=3365874 RepID=UPI00382FAFEB
MTWKARSQVSQFWSGRRGRLGAGLVVRERARDHASAGEANAAAVQVVLRFQLVQGGRDPGLALREAVGEDLDADLRPGGQRLDVRGEADRDEGQLVVLGRGVCR